MIGEELLLGKPLPTWLGDGLPLENATIGANTATSHGTTLTSGATNTKGSYVELVDSAPFDADGFMLIVSDVIGDNNMIDIALGPLGSEVPILSNFVFECSQFIAGLATFIPLPIPAGSRVSARVQNQSASSGIKLDVSLVLMRNSPFAHLGLKKATTYGAVTATTEGQTLTYAGSPNTKGDWVELASSTTGLTKMLLLVLGIQGAVSKVRRQALVDVGVGDSGSEVAIFENLATVANDGADVWTPFTFLLPVRIPAGSRLVARQQMVGDTVLGAIAIGFS